jgi:hypothetical protein
VEISEIVRGLESIALGTNLVPYERAAIEAAIEKLTPPWLRIERAIEGKPAVMISKLQTPDTYTATSVLQQHGYTNHRVYREGRYYSIWLAPGQQYPKLHLDNLLKEKLP